MDKLSHHPNLLPARTSCLPVYFAALIAGKSDGTFVVRPKGQTEADGYILTVIYKGKPTHHALGERVAEHAPTASYPLRIDCNRIS
jgi:hypothetical protein